jgi:hypothetical protein
MYSTVGALCRLRPFWGLFLGGSFWGLDNKEFFFQNHHVLEISTGKESVQGGSMLSKWLLRVVQIAGVLSAVVLLKAQINRGVIEGIVTDPQGAFVAGAEITITAVDTNVRLSSITNGAGYYRVVDLVPGKYRVYFASAGFSPVDVTDIQLPAGEVIRVDAQLKIGTTREVVEVKAELPLLETGAANSSTSLGTESIQQVPLQGRDLQQLVFLVPGINSVAGPPGSNFGFNSEFGTFPDPTHGLGSDISVNGGQGGANAWYLDGNLNLSGMGENVTVNPSPDAVGEFQAITNAFSAEYGRTGGGVFNVVLKSGTNAVHGNVYEFLRNDATNARNPFTSIDALGNIIKDRQLRFNNFGGTLGGPVVLPHVFNGKDKTFFFFSLDQQTLHLLGNKKFTVPTARMRQGDFSEDPNTAQFGIWDPFSTVGPNSQGTFQRTAFGTPLPGNPFGANGCLNSSVEAGAAQGVPTCNFASQIPLNRLDPTAMFFLRSFPLPNFNDPLSSCPMGKDGFKICNNFLGAVGSSQNSTNLSLKIDHQWSEKSRYFAEWLFDPGKYRNYRVPWTGPTYPMDLTGFGSQYPVDFGNQIIALGNTYTLRPTLINEFRASFSRQSLNTHPSHPLPDSITDQSEVLRVLAPIKLPLQPLQPLPNWQVSSPAGGYMPFGLSAWVNMFVGAEAYTILDNITKVIGKHTLKTGFVYRLEHSWQASGGPTIFNFYGELVTDPVSGLGGGSGLAQFMLGAVPTAGSESFSALKTSFYQRWRYWGFYFQDDYHISPRFTLNWGLRYDIFGAYHDRNFPNSNICLTCLNPLTGLPGKASYEGDPGYPKGDVFPPNWNDIAPRVNFAWTPFADRKTVIRGGYDIFYSNAYQAVNSPQSAPNGPGWNSSFLWLGSFYPNKCAPFTGQCVAFPLSDTTTDKHTLTIPPFPSVFPAVTRDPLFLQALDLYAKPPHDPMVQMWSFELQRQLPGDTTVSLGYVGQHGTHLVGDTFKNFNYVHTTDLLKYRNNIYDVIPITDVYSGLTAAKLQQVYGSSSLPRSILLETYPFFSGLYSPGLFNGMSIYHGMNLRVQKRMSQGLDFVAAYTVSKKIINADTGQLPQLYVDPIHFARNGGLGGRAGELSARGGFSPLYQDPDNTKVDRTIAPDDIPQTLNVGATYQLPFGAGRRFVSGKEGVWNHIIGGWMLTGNFNAQSGLPLGITCPGNQLTSRCDWVADPHFSGSRSKEQRIAQWINPAAFLPPYGGDQSFWSNYSPTDPRAWQFGTSGPDLPNFRSPGFWNLDSSLSKQFHITESRYFEFRWEAFNILNHQNLGLPNTSFCLPPNPDGSTDRVHQAGCQFGRITNIQTDPRSMEFALKFYW